MIDPLLTTEDFGYKIVGQHRSPSGGGGGISFGHGGHPAPDLHADNVPQTSDGSDLPDWGRPGNGGRDQDHAEPGGLAGEERPGSYAEPAGYAERPGYASPAGAPVVGGTGATMSRHLSGAQFGPVPGAQLAVPGEVSHEAEAPDVATDAGASSSLAV